MKKQRFNKITALIIAAILICTMLLSVACVKRGDDLLPDGGNSGSGSAVSSGDNAGSGDNKPDENPGSGDLTDPDEGDDDPPVQPVEKTIWLDELKYTYQEVGHGNLSVNQDSNGNMLSLYENGEETEYEHGYYAHAYSVMVFDSLETRGFTKFSTVIGVNKTARVANTQTSIVFRIFVDNEEVFTSSQFGAYTDSEYVEVNIEGADRLTLIADSLGSNGHDHAVWADCQFTYFDDIKPDLQVYDTEFPSPYAVTKANLLACAKATAADGTNITDKITYSTNYKAGEIGEFYVTYKVSDGKSQAEKTVKIKVLSSDRFVYSADSEYLSTPFADFVYYGRSLLSKESRKAYDLLLEKLLKVNLADSSISTLTVNLQDEGIYILPNEAAKIKKFLVYDEARLYYLYDWRAGESAGVSVTKKNGLIDTITIKLYNGSGEYYNGQNNMAVWQQAETKVSSFFSKLTFDMTDAQLLYSAQNSYCPTISYSNEVYADGFYGAFINGRCICSGYSKGYLYLAQRLGVRTAYVVGSAGGAHAWNYLFADGGWYMTDTTWGNGNSFGLLGKSYMDSSGRYDNANYGTMPVLSQERYDLDLMKYPLMSIKSGEMIAVGEKLDLESLVSINGTVVNKAPLTSVSYKGDLNLDKAGEYNIEITAQNSLGNIITGECEIYVYNGTEKLSSIAPVMAGNSNYSFRKVSLYYGGQEREFADGIYTKANGTLTLSFDISSESYTHFSAYVGIDKVIRDNVPWGEYANATVKVYADDEVLFQLGGIGWKKDMTYIVVKLPENAKVLKLEITDTSGQGGVGWGDCLLYN